MEKLIKLIEEPKIPIVIFGDTMIDEYINVDCKRISPEFPLPIYLSETEMPSVVVCGGAGNLAYQFKWLNTDVNLVSFLDNYSSQINENNGIKENGVFLPEGHHVPIKRRIYHGDYPLVRWDIEKQNYGLPDNKLKELQNKLFKIIPTLNNSVVIFSDYNKGVFCNLDKIPMPENCISIVDPKKGPLEKWKGCSIFKPNAKEAEELTGEKDWRKQSAKIQEVTGCTAVIITQGSDGIAGIVGSREFEFRPDKKVLAESCISAGDCFMARLATSQACGMDILDGIELAWHAGSLYVQNKHNKPVHPLELAKYIDPINGKIIDPKWLINRDFKLVFSNGCFDCLGVHHMELLRFAKTKGEKLVVAINSDESVCRLKGNGRPIVNEADRMQALSFLDCVDFVVKFDEDTPLDLIKGIHPDVIVKGGDYNAEDVVGGEIVGKENVIIFGKKEGYSTTNLISKIKSM